MTRTPFVFIVGHVQSTLTACPALIAYICLSVQSNTLFVLPCLQPVLVDCSHSVRLATHAMWNFFSMFLQYMYFSKLGWPFDSKVHTHFLWLTVSKFDSNIGWFGSIGTECCLSHVCDFVWRVHMWATWKWTRQCGGCNLVVKWLCRAAPICFGLSFPFRIACNHALVLFWHARFWSGRRTRKQHYSCASITVAYHFHMRPH